METFAVREAALCARLAAMPDPQERLSWIVEQARRRPDFPPDLRTDEHRVPGCAARLWIAARMADGRCQYFCDSDSAILKAVAGLLCDLYRGLPPDDVANSETTFLSATGLDRQLTENRRRTILRVRQVIREFAAQHSAVA